MSWKGPYTVRKPWGREVIWAQASTYVGKRIFIDANRRLSRQYHERKEETITVVSGTLLLEIGLPKVEFSYVLMNPGDTYHIAPLTVHRMCAITDVELVEVSTPELDDVVRLEDDYGR